MAASVIPDVKSSAIASTPPISTNRKQPPSYSSLCDFLATTNLQAFHPSTQEQIPDVSTLEATNFRFQDANQKILYNPYLKLHEQLYGSAATIDNQQYTNMEMGSAYLPPLATSFSQHLAHDQWPTSSTAGNLCWTSGSLSNIMLSRYPLNLGGGIRRVDANAMANVHCPCKECQSQTLCDTRLVTGQTQPAAASSKIYVQQPRMAILLDSPAATVKNISSDHEHGHSRRRDYQKRIELKELKCVLGPTNDVLHEAIPIASCVQTPEADEGNQPTAVNDRQKLCGKPLVTAVRNNRQNVHTGKLALPPLDFLHKEVRSSKRPRKASAKPKPKVSGSDYSSGSGAGLSIYRAARGCAVHPRSISERLRRSRIAHRMRVLETKLPDPIKNKGKRRLYADEMLDRTINYIKWLQESIKVLLCDEITMGDLTGRSEILYVPQNCNEQTGGSRSGFRLATLCRSPNGDKSVV